MNQLGKALRNPWPRYLAAVALLLPSGYFAPALAANAAGDSEKQLYSTPVREHTRSLYWGDTHLHTKLSADAFTMHTRLTPDDAYRFARGETVTADNGMPARLRRPLDFLAVTDHAEYLGIYALLLEDDESLRGWSLGQRWSHLLKEKKSKELGKEFSDAIQRDDAEYQVPEVSRRSVWDEVGNIADKYNEPGLFTALIGYEWTSMISGDNLHRVVLFKDNSEKTSQVLPFSAQHSLDPEDLWQALAHYEETTGGEVLAIAHNGNVSNGRMFSPYRENGLPLDTAYAETRARWEPVYEVTQIKGDGETHPYLSPEDEFADFETWDEGNITLTEAKEPEMLQYEYARSALREGLRHEASLGVNPFKFGMIGSSDMHTALSATAEDNFFGKFAADEPAPDRAKLKMADQLQEIWKLVASGLAGVWAEENTREAIFDAFKRREVYATSGPRIQVRFFGGWDFESDDVQRPNYATIGYAKGVPMGGDLVAPSPAGAPRFMVAASRDPDGANLDRVQIVKGWLEDDGTTREKIYNVALSDGREVDPQTGRALPVGNTVNLDNASYLNSIGDPELATVWTDPDFDPDQRAFYYVRVLQIPTPRWTVYDAEYFDIEMPEEAMISIQDRAYTSPIWYTPTSASASEG